MGTASPEQSAEAEARKMKKELEELKEQVTLLNKAVQEILMTDFVGTQTLLNLLITKQIITFDDYQLFASRIKQKLEEDPELSSLKTEEVK